MSVYSFMDLVSSLVDVPPKVGGTRAIAVDGRSGSGKTTFADRLGRHVAVAGVDVTVVHTDDLLDGWGHPTGFGPFLQQWIINPLNAGCPASYRAYDWEAEQFGYDWRYLGNPEMLILDGVATAAADWRAILSFSILVAADPAVCRHRGFTRDGGALREPLAAWHAHEDEIFASMPTGIDLIVDGDPDERHDPENEFVGREASPRH